MSQHDADVVVIGAGVIGVSCALALQQAGKQVLLVDRAGLAAGASQGNAGAFAFTDIEPLATPGIIRKAPKWLFDPLGPLSIRPGYMPQLLPWLLRFWRASWRDRYEAAVKAQSALMQLSQRSLEEVIRLTDAESLFLREGQLQLYEGKSRLDASMPNWDLKKNHGIEFTLLHHQDDIAVIQPGLDPRFTHAAFTPAWMNVCNPARWVEHLASAFVVAGGSISTFEVNDLEVLSNGIKLTGPGGKLHADQVVVAGGAWSKPLAKSLGDALPLDTERGYNTTFPEGAFDVRTHLSFPDHAFVVSKIDGGVRVGGAVEFGGLKRKPDYRRAQYLLDKAGRFLPALNKANGREWMGFRPSMPDSLPVIDYSTQSERVIYCFGHGHLGLTQSAGSADLVKALALNLEPTIDMRPYSVARFSY